MLCFDKKRHIKVKKYITSMNFADHVKNQTFQRIAKFAIVDSYKIDFMKV